MISKTKDNKHFLQNVSWLLVSEIVSKVSRLLVVIALAANLSAIEYGTVMLALAFHEVFKVILRSGAGAQVVQCASTDLPKYAQNAFILQWLVCAVLAASQTLLAIPIASFYDNSTLFELMAGMASIYLLYPLVSVKVFLLQRANNMRFYSIRNAVCIILENMSIAAFALLDFGLWSVVYGKWVFVTSWLLCFYWSPVKTYGLGFHFATFLSLCKTSGQLICTESIKSIRMQLDMIIGARLLSPELFGIYCFAKSAGVGLTQSICNAYIAGLYPYLCKKRRNLSLNTGIRSVYLITLCVASLFAVQAVLVPIYVPVLFNQEWQQNYTVVMLLCMAAIPALLIDTQCCFIRAKGHFKNEIYVRLYCLICSAVCILVFQADSPDGFAVSILVGSFFWLTTFLPIKALRPSNQSNKHSGVKI
jgi:PST family polysaccharide transporter